jgi:DNA-binding HxlR family transcriptional regulator
MNTIEPSSLSRKLCPVMKAISFIGDKWILLILRECFVGFKRFEDYQENLGISRSVLSARLNKMIYLDLLYKKPYKEEGERMRLEYRLTARGWDLVKVVIALMEWGNEHLVEKGAKTLQVVQRGSSDNPRLILLNNTGDRVDWYDLELRVIDKI